ncbi:MAG TPA: GNAT family N-acetyltransferase [Acidimicrobiia bacterium]|nr:GNAT family N-acetyltransferase [Acidimicrobiia bacterium]
MAKVYQSQERFSGGLEGHREGDKVGVTVHRADDTHLPVLVDLFNSAFAGYGGFAERSVEDFRWRHLDRPDVGTEGVIVVEDARQRVIGYVVVGTSGTIWEFAIDPDSDRREVASLLIAEAERHLIGRGIDEIVLHAPVDDLDMSAALRMAGYGGRPAIQQFLSFLDLPGVVERVLVKHEDAWPSGLGPVEFVIKNPRPWHPERFSVPARANLPFLTISTSVEDLIEVMVGSLSPGRAAVGRRVRITPVSKTATGLKVLNALRLRNPFFFTLADVI